MVLFRLLTASRLTGGLALASSFLVLAGAAAAQTATPPTYGPPIAGECLFGRDDAIDHSKIGVTASQQLVQYAKEIDADLKAQGAAIQADDRALVGQKASLSAADYQQKVNQLRQRYADLSRLQKLRATQLGLTRSDALTQIGAVILPSLSSVVTARHCSVVFERAATYGSAAAMDITPAVIQQMDATQSALTLKLATPEAAQAAR
jgi:Skp family chaperone for outer membrane proteins